MIKEAYEKLHRISSKNKIRHLFLVDQKKIISFTDKMFKKVYPKYSTTYLGAFTKHISLPDFREEVQAGIDQINADEAYIDAIEAEVGNGAGMWVNHSCGRAYRWDLDDLPTQKEVRNLKTIQPVEGCGRRSFQTA